MTGFSQLFQEMRRRKLFRVAAGYAVVAWLLVEVASVVLPTFEAPDWILQVFTFLMILGFPVALILAWAYELTPEGLQRDPSTVGANVNQQECVDATTETAKTIAVLPFVNMSDDEKNRYFCDGITEEITSKLARLGQLRVAARTSAARFRNADMDIREIAQQLGVRYVLEGSIRKSSERVRTSIQLIDSSDGLHLWAEEFDGRLDDIFAVQEEAAIRVADALDLRVTPDEERVIHKRYTENSKAYDAYLEGQALVQYTDDFEKLRAARRHFERALSYDPDYPAALAGLASVAVHTYRNFESDREQLEVARTMAARALKNGPSLARAHVAAGEVCAIEYKYSEAAERFRDAIRIQSDDPWTWDSLSWVLGYQQPPDGVAAEKAAREAIRMQPQFSTAYYHLGRALTLQGRYDEAAAAFEHVSELSKNAAMARYGMALVHLARGKHERALLELDASSMSGAVVRIVRASALAGLERTDDALQELEAALEAGFRDFAGLDADMNLAALRDDPRYTKLIERYRNEGIR